LRGVIDVPMGSLVSGRRTSQGKGLDKTENTLEAQVKLQLRHGVSGLIPSFDEYRCSQEEGGQ
jgi:hypothetical protein